MILNGFQKNHFSEQVCGTRDPPPFMEKTILYFHFDNLTTPLNYDHCVEKAEIHISTHAEDFCVIF